jgi:hypothetical protein
MTIRKFIYYSNKSTIELKLICERYNIKKISNANKLTLIKLLHQFHNKIDLNAYIVRKENMDEEIDFLRKFNSEILLKLAEVITNKLNEKQEQLLQCKWTDGESNTDTDFSELACKIAEDSWELVKQYFSIPGITMTASKPDIICTFSKNEKEIKVSKNKIELKSSKNNVMPGSTIGKLDINEPLIYCLRTKNNEKPYEIRYGQYHTAMGESNTDLFQDRTPRPQINFTKLSTYQTKLTYSSKTKDEWILHYAKCAVHRIKNDAPPSWQDTLTKNIIYEALQNIETIEDLNKLRESVRTT